MAARAGVIGFCVLLAVAALTPVQAGLPRGAVLSAAEQDADPETGITIATGSAEIVIEAQRIVGRADRIEIRPASKAIVFSGHAVIRVGSETFQGDVVSCALDFAKCSTGAEQPVAASAQSAVAPAQPPVPPLQQPSALGAGAADTNPR